MSHPILKKDRYSRRRALKAIIILPSFKRMLLQGSWLRGGMPQWLAIYQHVALQILEYNWMLPGFVSGFWNKGKKGGTIQMPSKPKWSFSFIGKKWKSLQRWSFWHFAISQHIIRYSRCNTSDNDNIHNLFAKELQNSERKVEKSIPRWEMNRHSGGYKWVIDQNWSYGKNRIFLAKTEILGPKKAFTS